MLKTISRKQMYRHLKKQFEAPKKVENKEKIYYNRKQKHKDVWSLDDNEE